MTKFSTILSQLLLAEALFKEALTLFLAFTFILKSNFKDPEPLSAS